MALGAYFFGPPSMSRAEDGSTATDRV